MRQELSGVNKYSLDECSPFIFRPVTFCPVLETLKSLSLLTGHFKTSMALKPLPVNAAPQQKTDGHAKSHIGTVYS